MTLALDGAPVAGNSSTQLPITVTLSGFSTSSPNDVIVLLTQQDGTTAAPTISGGGLTWIQRAVTNSGTDYVYIFYAIASSPVSSATITITSNFGGAPASYVSGIVFGISGANTSSPWDAGGPVYGTTSASLSITTVNANTFLIGYWASANNNSYTLGSGFSALDINNVYQVGEYKIVSSIGAQTVSITGGAVDVGIADAIVASGGGGTPVTFASIAIPRKMFLKPKRPFYVR